MAYTPDSIWRNRDQFLQGRDAIEKFLTDKWSKENGYRLRKELFAFSEDKVFFSILNFIRPQHPVMLPESVWARVFIADPVRH